MLKVLSNILCDLDPKVKVIGQKASICDGVPSTSALVFLDFEKNSSRGLYKVYEKMSRNSMYTLFCFRFYVPVNIYRSLSAS